MPEVWLSDGGNEMPDTAITREDLRGRVDRFRRDQRATDDALRRYRDRRRTYDAQREKRQDTPQYREQRGVRRGYRV